MVWSFCKEGRGGVLYGRRFRFYEEVCGYFEEILSGVYGRNRILD